MKHLPTNKPLTILFDAEALAQSNKSGVGYYTHQIITSLAREYPDDLRLIGHYYNFLGRKHPDLPTGANISYRTTRLIPGKVLSLLRRKLGFAPPLELLARSQGDVLFFPNFAISPSLFKKPRAVTIHDLYFIERPDHIQTKNLMHMRRSVPAAARHADLVLAISEFTKQAIIKNYDVSAKKIIVTPIPPQITTYISESDRARALYDLGVSGDFILFIGNLEPRKNLTTLLKAYELLDKELQKKYSLVLAGGPGWNDTELREALDHAQNNNLAVITPGYITDEQRTALYANAAVVAVPSLYEGFGMQLLEAMSSQVPVLASDIPIFHEVGGDACLYVPTQDPRQMAHGLERILTDAALRNELIKRGHDRLKQYDPKSIAQDVYERFQKLAQR